ncbi:protein FAM47E, partial [Vulpes lagopus]|uniref:protein FAM47E n=1 Tax=Vulpes lagopus TaxID=494514 RepID=UPI001BC91EBA
GRTDGRRDGRRDGRPDGGRERPPLQRPGLPLRFRFPLLGSRQERRRSPEAAAGGCAGRRGGGEAAGRARSHVPRGGRRDSRGRSARPGRAHRIAGTRLHGPLRRCRLSPCPQACPPGLGPGGPKKTSVSHPGQWLNEGKKLSETDLFHEDGPLLHENVHKGVRDFCNWATAFGSSNIDEEFILKQFDIDYQSKPSHDVPHTRRLNQVPLELKKRVGLKKLQKPQFFQKLDYEQKHQKPQDPHNAKCVKMRYGAWYLDTKLWKKQRADERLLDPKVSCRAQDENFKRELQEQFLEKMYIRKERKCDCNKTSIK